MANLIVSVHAGIYGMGIYAIMLPSSGFSVAYYKDERRQMFSIHQVNTHDLLVYSRLINQSI